MSEKEMTDTEAVTRQLKIEASRKRLIEAAQSGDGGRIKEAAGDFYEALTAEAEQQPPEARDLWLNLELARGYEAAALDQAAVDSAHAVETVAQYESDAEVYLAEAKRIREKFPDLSPSEEY